MPPFSPFSLLKKNHTESPSTSAPASGLASSQVTQQLEFPTNLQSPQEKQQSQPVGPWSAHIPPSGRWPSPFPRYLHTVSTTATAASELYLFGGMSLRPNMADNRPLSDLYVISTQGFSPTLLQTSGDVPSPRYGHRAILTGTTLLISGGTGDDSGQFSDDSLYLLNLVLREWTRIVVNGPGPGARSYHTLGLVGSKVFVFGGWDGKRYLNDIWALDLNCLKSNPFWESYEPAPGNKKPLPRSSHVSVTTGDRIIIFGGIGDHSHFFNDTWSFNISTRKWTEVQCTGSIPTPRSGHAAVLIGDVMYVYGGGNFDGTYLGDLTVLNLTTQRWIAFQDIGPSPSGRKGHAVACDGTRVFVLGGILSPGVQADETKLIHVLDTQHLVYPEPDSGAINSSEKTTQLVGKSSGSPPTRGQPYQPSSFSLDAHAAHHTSPFRKAVPGEPDHPMSQQITRERNRNPSDLPSRSTGASGRPRRVSEEGEDSREHYAKLVAPDAPPRKEIAQLEGGRLTELERQLSETLVDQTERDRRIGQLTDGLALKSALLARATEEKKFAGLELRELQAKLNESLVSRDRALEQAELELRKLQVKHDESLVSRDHALEQAGANVAEEKRRAGLEQRELQAKLDDLLFSRDYALIQAEANAAEAKRAGLEQRELQAKLDESILSRDELLRTLEQAQSALQKATSHAAEADERSQTACGHATELAEVRAELEAKKSELAAVRLRLTDAAEDGLAKNKAEDDKLRAQTGAGLINTEVDRVMHRLMERIRAMETEISSLRGNEKSMEDMECSNE